ncbi:GNAT family N-acetyltransferase [Streptomonospora salina]|uniref:GNAT superfamily N-acetyltransferase n=2 Tax=Streptomonospora salina TaxID=104205 RepID=A0A841E9N8_9ACTN|nr:GNAT family N-acetyltransferase [Streptomonospora salina]MBB5997230.1 GNAT superfamily N-acetyltransferase [Streptomonospora salina]
METQQRPDVEQADASHIEAIVDLADRWRRDYRRHAPGFRDPAPDARERHRARVGAIVADRRSGLALVATRGSEPAGCLLAVLGPAADVYAPGGELARIDDFWVADPADWWGAGAALLEEARPRLRALGAARIVVEAGGHDSPKQAFLWRSGLTLASERYQASL